MPQLRQNPITGEWVVIAPERAKRPSDFIAQRFVRTDIKESCVFCVTGTVYEKERLQSFETELVYVVPNKYPAFIEDPEACSPRSVGVESNFYSTRPSTGGHDVVVVKDHATSLTEFDAKTWHDLLHVTRNRVAHFYHSCNVAHVMPIYNHRHEAGASIYHPHSQLFASNIIPNHIAHELHHSERYFEDKGSCIFCDLVHHEREESRRVVYETTSFIAFTFYAARFPFELWVLPKRHMTRFERIDDSLMYELSHFLEKVFTNLGEKLNNPPLNYVIHTLPSTVKDADYYHWHLEITPRLSNYGGYEIGSGVVIDVMSPETAARYLSTKKAR